MIIYFEENFRVEESGKLIWGEVEVFIPGQPFTNILEHFLQLHQGVRVCKPLAK